MNNATTLDKLGYREIGQLAELLKLYADNPNDCGLNDGVNWEYNPMSDSLFLVDSDSNVAMINSDTGKLEKFYSCGHCDHEGFDDDFFNELERCKKCGVDEEV